MRHYTFKYSPEPSRRGIVHRLVAFVHLQSKDGVWYLFCPYVDSGADASLFPRGDASLLKLSLYDGEYSPIAGVGKVMMPASVPELSGCHTQAKTLDGLMERVRETIQAYLEAEGVKPREGVELIGFQFVEVPAH